MTWLIRSRVSKAWKLPKSAASLYQPHGRDHGVNLVTRVVRTIGSKRRFVVDLSDTYTVL